MVADRRVASAPGRRAHRAAFAAGLAALALLLALAPRAEAKRFFIPQEYKTIQAGIDKASTGDTIWVAAGTYPGGIVMKKSLVLFGDAGAENTILDGGDSVRVLEMEGLRNAAVVGFTIRRGKANSGGGVHCVRDTSILFAGCFFEKNWESAISAWDTRDVNLTELRFEGNTGSAVTLQYSSVIARSCEFVKNHGYVGGAMNFVHSSATLPIRNCAFSENSADDATGGAVNVDSSDVLIAECLFRNNSAKVAGGALAIMNGSKVALSRLHFVGNHAAASGAVHADHGGVNIAMSLFEKNDIHRSGVGDRGRGARGGRHQSHHREQHVLQERRRRARGPRSGRSTSRPKYERTSSSWRGIRGRSPARIPRRSTSAI